MNYFCSSVLTIMDTSLWNRQTQICFITFQAIITFDKVEKWTFLNSPKALHFVTIFLQKIYQKLPSRMIKPILSHCLNTIQCWHPTDCDQCLTIGRKHLKNVRCWRKPEGKTVNALNKLFQEKPKNICCNVQISIWWYPDFKHIKTSNSHI